MSRITTWWLAIASVTVPMVASAACTRGDPTGPSGPTTPVLNQEGGALKMSQPVIESAEPPPPPPKPWR